MVYLIYGSPCSGKTTYIKEHIKQGDIVCDVDNLYSAISLNEPHNSEIYAEETASELYDHLLDIIRDRKGHWKNAYVVSLAKTEEQVDRMRERIKADECVFIDTPMEECLKRAQERPFYFPWIIEEWFARRSLNECNS